MIEVKLSIDAENCTACGKCIRVCPSKIIHQSLTDAKAFVESSKGCISCGHCVAVCQSGAVIHSEFTEEKVHPLDYAQYPTAEQMMLLCKGRRSNRVFSKKAIPAETLDVILEAAHRAPTASNQQQLAFTLVTDPEKLRQIVDFTIGVFSSSVKKLNNPFLKPFLKRIMPDAYRYVKVFSRMRQEQENGNDPILRKATAVILIHAPKSNRFGLADANLAYQNGSLMAETLGVSQVYMGFVCAAVNLDKKGSLAELLGIDGKIHAVMALGMPAFKYANYIDRKEIKVTKI